MGARVGVTVEVAVAVLVGLGVSERVGNGDRVAEAVGVIVGVVVEVGVGVALLDQAMPRPNPADRDSTAISAATRYQRCMARIVAPNSQLRKAGVRLQVRHLGRASAAGAGRLTFVMVPALGPDEMLSASPGQWGVLLAGSERSQAEGGPNLGHRDQRDELEIEVSQNIPTLVAGQVGLGF